MTRHRPAFDPIALAFGLVFVAAAALWLVTRLATVRPAAVGWLVAGGLVLLGLAGLSNALAAAHRRHRGAGPPDPTR